MTHAFDARPSSRSFVTLLNVLRPSGGAARSADLAHLLDDKVLPEAADLQSLIGTGQIFGFTWLQVFWVPMFQFEMRNLRLKAGPQRVRAELGPAFDGWDTAAWFGQPNSWLDQHTPLDLLDRDCPAVLEAARADRFVAVGR
jgi:hypothetical protein